MEPIQYSYLNTSHVKVNQWVYLNMNLNMFYLNTSHIKVNQIFINSR